MGYFCSDAFPLFIDHLKITMSYKLHTALWSYIFLFHLLPCSNWLNDSHHLSYCIRAYRLEPQYSHDIVEINHHWFGRCRIWRKHYTLLRLACAHRPDTLYIIATQKGQQCLVIHCCQLQQQESHWSETLTYHNIVDIYGFFMIHFRLKYTYRKAVYFI